MSPIRALAALALIIGLAHLPFLPASLEDIDSVNFALGVRDFDVADHRPHPPGYPVYIGLGKVSASIVGAMPGAGLPSSIEARALALVSLLAAIVAPLLLYRSFAALVPVRNTDPPWWRLQTVALLATALALASPLLWTLTVRPMSDLPGLTFALVAQACLLTAWWWQAPDAAGERRMSRDVLVASGRMIVLGACIAGVAVGLRTQTLWLTAPLLVVVLFDRIGRGVAGAIAGGLMTFTIGSLLWAVPLIVASGGLQGYLDALGTQAGEDFAGGEMLYLNPAPRLIAFALIHTFVDPWDSVPLATVVLALAAVGTVVLLWRDRRSLTAVLAMTVPYLVFHLLFQDTSFTRYSAPLVPVVAWLAIRGLAAFGSRVIVPAGGLITIVAAIVGMQSLAGYARTSAPAVQAVAAMNAEASHHAPAALAMHQTFRRPLQAELVGVQPQLDSPPRREWLELAKYWNDGHGGTIWFLADPRRSDLALIDPRSRQQTTSFRWEPASRPSFGGMRPAAVDWVRIEPPGWFAEDGWALTPETAGMARLMGRGPSIGPITARVRRDDAPHRVLVGGRNLAGAGDPSARFTLGIDGRAVESWEVPPGFFLRTIDLPAGALAGDGRFAALTMVSTPAAVPSAIEQFDVQPAGEMMWGFDEGWNEAEYSPALGIWHWTSDRAVVRVVGAASPLRVTLRIEPPARYFAAPSEVTASAGPVILAKVRLFTENRMTFDVPLDAIGDGRIAIETAQSFVPAQRGGPPDRRRLGLRVFEIRIDRVGLR